jgi:4-amino-4-deoxy-L-arabinose transferase-like glycosyltransferase
MWGSCGLSALLWPLGLLVNVQDHDEAVYHETAREMIESGDWTDPHCNYQPWYGKPAMSMWLIAAAFRFLGVEAWVGRIPALLGAVLIVWMTYLLGRRLFGPAEGAVAAAFCAAAPALSLMGHNVKIDMNLIVFTTGATLLAHMALDKPWLYLLAGASGGLAVLTKGPIGVALPGLILVAAWTWDRRWGDVLRAWRWVALGVVSCLVVWAPWNVVMYQRYRQVFVDVLYMTDSLKRFSGPSMSGEMPLLFFPATLLWAAGPAIPAVLVGLVLRARALRGRWTRPPFATVDLAWLILPTLLMETSNSKLPHYVFPVLPGLCVVAAHGILALVRGGTAHRLGWLTRAGTVFMSAMGLAFAGAMITVCFPPAEGHLLLLVFLACAAALVPLTWLAAKGHAAALVASPCLAGIMAVALHNGAARPELIRFQPAPMVARVLDQDGAPRGTRTHVFALKDADRVSLNFYGRMRVDDARMETLKDQVGAQTIYLMTPASYLPEIRALGLRTRVRGFNLVFRTSMTPPRFAMVGNREEMATPVVLLQVWDPSRTTPPGRT